MKFFKRQLALLLALGMVFICIMPAYADEVNAQEATPSDAKRIAEMDSEEVNTWAALQAAINAAGTSETTITIAESLKAGDNDSAVTIPENRNIILDLNGKVLDRGLEEAKEDGYVIKVENGAALTIKDSVGDGSIIGGYNKKTTGSTNAQGGGVYVAEGGSLILESGTISWNKAESDAKAYGGGVYTAKGASFTMTGGEIANCTADCGGGILAGGIVSLSGGVLGNNRALENGGGIYVGTDETDDGLVSVVFLPEGTPGFIMSGGTIIGCSAAMSGGGLYLGMDARISGGTINGCNSETMKDGHGGGGIYVPESVTLVLSEANLEYNWAASAGGGIYNLGTAEMTDADIRGNTALEGAGIFNAGTMNMQGGSVVENEATIAAGGISNIGRFEIAGGSICGNKGIIASGVYLYNNAELILSGGNGECIISDNANELGECNIYIRSGDTITVNDSFTGGNIGITTEAEPEFGMNVIFAKGDGAEAAAPCFTSDQGYNVICEGGTLCLKAGLRIGDGSGTAIYGDDLSSTGITYALISPAPVTDQVTLLWSEEGAPSTWTISVEEEMLIIRPCDASGTVFAQPGSYSFRVQTGGVVSENEAVFTVAPRKAEIEWTSGQLYYNGKLLAPSARVRNQVPGDELIVIVTGAETRVGTGYTATAEALTGKGSENYALPVPRPTVGFSIKSQDSEHSTDDVAGAKNKATYSSYWFQTADGIWQVHNRTGQMVVNAWLCDDAITSNGQNVWYLLGADGAMMAAGLVQDNTGNFYSLETEHNGYFGMLRYQNGTYNCNGQQVYLTFNHEHNGSFGAITNAEGLEKLKQIYGVTQYGIGNENSVYTAAF